MPYAARMKAATTSRFHSVDVDRLAPEIGEAEVDVELEQIDASGLLDMHPSVRDADRTELRS